MELHPGLPGGSFGDRSWPLPDGALVRRVGSTDLEALRIWRNEQQSVLRQQEPLTPTHQREWFERRVKPSYSLSHPSEVLVIVELSGQPVSYGGLTNIEWTSRRGELSFLTATNHAKVPHDYERDFNRFLGWVKRFTFVELGLNRLFTETWASRKDHIALLEASGFKLEGRMRDHIVKEGLMQDALLHGLIASDQERA